MQIIKVLKHKTIGKIEKYKKLKARNALYIENISRIKGDEEVIFPSGTESLY